MGFPRADLSTVLLHAWEYLYVNVCMDMDSHKDCSVLLASISQSLIAVKLGVASLACDN